jgi:general secretion pathway protein D
MKSIFFILLTILLFKNLLADELININFKDMKLVDLVKITSKIINKNILLTQEIEGTIDFIPNDKVSKEELLAILKYSLDEKGYELVEENNILRVIKKEESKNESIIIKLKNVDVNFAKQSLENISKQLEDKNTSIIENSLDNSIMIISNKKNLEYLQKYIKNIDNSSLSTKKLTKIINLKNSDATNIIKIVEDVVNKKTYLNSNLKPVISSDVESNSIIVMGNVDEVDSVYNLIEELDKEKTQVYVQAKIIEVNDDLVNQIGVSYGIFGAKSVGNVLSSFSASLNKGEIPTFFIDGIKIPDMSSGLALGASINLLKQSGALDIVSEPSILAINNKESSIYVGETISIKVSSSVTDGGTVKENFEREDVGLTLKVKPRISNETKVILDIETILEGVKTTQTVSGNADTSKKQIKTTAILNNGESVIIGGLIENKSEKTEQKVPVLGDVPLFGELFKNSVENAKKNNLVIIVTPYLIPKTKDITYIRNKLSELKNLEDRYLENSLIKLRNQQLKNGNFIKKEENLNQISSKNEHENRVKEILGY